MDKKPCIQCGKDCEILPLQLGGIFTLSYLRICGSECMLLLSYDYLYEIGEHNSFINSLYDKEDKEDKAQRVAYFDKIIKEFPQMMGDNLNPNLLSMPIPEEIVNAFSDIKSLPMSSGSSVRFRRPSIKDKIKWQSDLVDILRGQLKEAMEDLEKLKNDCI